MTVSFISLYYFFIVTKVPQPVARTITQLLQRVTLFTHWGGRVEEWKNGKMEGWKKRQGEGEKRRMEELKKIL